MKKQLLTLITVVSSLNCFAQSSIVNCNNVTYSTDTLYVSVSNNIIHDTIYYNDTIAIAYPLHCLQLSDTSIISATTTFSTDSCFIFTGLASGPFTADDTVHFEYLITFHSTTFANNTIVNGYFHLLKTGFGPHADCYFPVTIILQNATGVNEMMDNEKIKVYPNPTVNELNIENNSTQYIQFTLYNSLGEKLINKTLTNKTSTINLSAYANDIYFYKVSSDKQEIKRGKIVKH